MAVSASASRTLVEGRFGCQPARYTTRIFACQNILCSNAGRSAASTPRLPRTRARDGLGLRDGAAAEPRSQQRVSRRALTGLRVSAWMPPYSIHGTSRGWNLQYSNSPQRGCAPMHPRPLPRRQKKTPLLPYREQRGIQITSSYHCHGRAACAAAPRIPPKSRNSEAFVDVTPVARVSEVSPGPPAPGRRAPVRSVIAALGSPAP
jgi:hypothetical protein